MLADVDTALRSMLAEALPPGTVVRFDAPEPSWRGGADTVSALLYRVVEDVSARAANWSETRDERGRVTARVPAARRYRVTYLVTAWAAEVQREHALLGSVLAALSAGRSVGTDMELAVASPEFAPAPLELWSALGIAPRASLEVVLTAPVPVHPDAHLPAAPDTVDLSLAGSPPPPPAPERPLLPPPRGRITERPA